jgi:prepilin-type processing-associated H-X9-DG protein
MNIRSDTVWVLEMANMGLLNNFEVEWAWTGDTPGITEGGGVRRLRNISERHKGMTNVLWCDGHARAMEYGGAERLQRAGRGPSLHHRGGLTGRVSREPSS